MAYPTEKIELPPKYYLEYFTYLVDFVERKYEHILNENEKLFIQHFKMLSEDEQCLFIRFVNRSGQFFRINKLKYEEIENIPEVTKKLIDKKFIEKPNETWLRLVDELLFIFPKSELLQLFKTAGISFKGHASYTKNETVVKLLSLIELKELIPLIAEYEPVIKINFEQEVMMLKFLFFGNRYDTMTEFVTRDLGFQKYQQFDEDKMVAHFANRQEAEDKLVVSLVGEKFYELAADLPAAELCIWLINWITVNEETLSEA
ncbi:MAG: VRR-NUC domain-containing protein, partial [Bacteroidota bacterium]